ncbi:DUF6624 domain-containing protein [Christiangramia marina]|uniref:DUF6624 domain-containing protein n=1 Tax=Christiangramia marina TaxID=409436 RepID=UPI003AA836AB
MKNYAFLLFIILLSSNMRSQTSFLENFKELSQQAYTEYQKENYQKSAELNVKVFRLLDKNNVEQKFDPAYNAICTFALAGEKDKAFEWLEFLVREGKLNNYNFRSDQDLKSLKGDPRWNKLIEQGKSKANMSENLKMVKSELQDIYKSDQEIRFKLMNLSNEMKEETNSENLKRSFQDLVVKMKKIDSINLSKIELIIENYGWLGQDKIGYEPSQALFLVIQHSDLETQLKYLPIIREAALAGDTEKSNLALIEDRVALRKGERQIYGSQIWTDQNSGKQYVDLLMDPIKVDERRSSMGLPPMKSYLQQFFGMDWNAEEYRDTILPKLIKIKKKSSSEPGDER